ALRALAGGSRCALRSFDGLKLARGLGLSRRVRGLALRALHGDSWPGRPLLAFAGVFGRGTWSRPPGGATTKRGWLSLMTRGTAMLRPRPISAHGGIRARALPSP